MKNIKKNLRKKLWKQLEIFQILLWYPYKKVIFSDSWLKIPSQY